MPSSFADMLQRSVIDFVIFFFSVPRAPWRSIPQVPRPGCLCNSGRSVFWVSNFLASRLRFFGSFVRSLPRSFVRSLVRLVLKLARSIFSFIFSFYPSCLPCFIPSFLRSFLGSFPLPFLGSFVRSSVCSDARSLGARPLSLVLLRSFIHSFAHTLPPFFLCSCTCLRSLVRLSPCVACSIALCFVSGC